MASTIIFLKALLLTLFGQTFAIPLLSRSEMILRNSYTS